MQKEKSIALILGVLVLTLLFGYFILAWQEPTQPPPQGNVPAPINVSSSTQVILDTKTLRIKNDASGALIIDGNLSANAFLSRYGTILAKESGNVGIGTVSPLGKLSIEGGKILHYADGGNYVAGANRLLQIGGGASAGAIVQNVSWPSYRSLFAHNVYITETDPQSIEKIRPDLRAYGLQMGHHIGKIEFFKLTGASSPFTYTGLMTILDNGNVGIGTTNPGYKLQVQGDISGTRLCIGSDCRSAWPAGGAGLFLTIEKQGRGNAGYVYCPNPFLQKVISAQYAGWDVGAKEDQWYGVWPIYRYTNNNVNLNFKEPVGAYFINTSGYWLTCADIGDNPSALIKVVGLDFEDLTDLSFPKMARIPLGGADKIGDGDLPNLFSLDYLGKLVPNFYVYLETRNGTSSLPRLSCDTGDNLECPDFVSNESKTSEYAQDKYYGTSYGWPTYYYKLFKRVNLITYGYDDGINPRKLELREYSYHWDGFKSWPSYADSFYTEKGEKILAVKITGSSDDGGICFVEVKKYKDGTITHFASFASTHQAYISSIGHTLGTDPQFIFVEMYNRHAGPMKNCWFDIRSLLGKRANQGPSTYDDACLHSDISSDLEVGSNVNYGFHVYGANADGPRGEYWDCRVSVLVEKP